MKPAGNLKPRTLVYIKGPPKPAETEDLREERKDKSWTEQSEPRKKEDALGSGCQSPKGAGFCHFQSRHLGYDLLRVLTPWKSHSFKQNGLLSHWLHLGPGKKLTLLTETVSV